MSRWRSLLRHHELVRGGGDHEPWGDRESRAQQLAQVGGFAAAAVQIPGAKPRQIDDEEPILSPGVMASPPLEATRHCDGLVTRRFG